MAIGRKKPAAPEPAPAPRAPEVTPPELEAESDAPISAPVAHQDDRAAPDEEPAEDDAPEPRLVFLLPRPSLRTVLSLLLVALMGASAWYLMNSSDDAGTQRLASVGATEEAAVSPATGDTASAISPPPSGAVSSKTLPPPSKTSQPASAQSTSKNAPVPSEKPALVTKVSAGNGPQYAIQLLATKSTSAGRSAWDQISAKHGDQLGDLGLDMQTVTLQGRGTFVRVRAGPIDDKKVAVSRCKALRAAGQDCLVVRF